ncbi:MAG: hypothetical protein M1840_003232 [Geoglossum simile]|nr:MAG: hypothetical protein M1840_003232 [Geoglossum simile]
MASANTSASFESFTFGVEIEILPKPKNTPFAIAWLSTNGYITSKSQAPGHPRRENAVAIHRTVVDALSQNGLLAIVVQDSINNMNYQACSIAWDTLIDETNLDQTWSEFFGIELISRVLVPGYLWQDEISLVWRVIALLFDIRLHPSCGTYVHVHLENGYKLDQLKSIAKAIAYFEPMVNLAMLLERQNYVWARNNMDQAALSPELTRIYDQA